VEYPTTRRLGATAVDRAAELHAAYADPDIRAVLATIGGDDEITVLPHLDPAPFVADPKPFLGYSANTNLLNWLWYHGVAAYHGGSTMVHLARGGGLQPIHVESLRAALFSGGNLEIHPVELFSDQEIRPNAMAVFGVDFGHTDPQWILPYGDASQWTDRVGGSPDATDPRSAAR
jgi:muramoyltetrapeptide carboxypeptidase LdcA involved in peptidoglycan recycling